MNSLKYWKLMLGLYCGLLTITDTLALGQVDNMDPSQAVLADLQTRFPALARERLILVNIGAQTLSHYHNGKLLKHYPVSTSVYGIGSAAGSNKTPLGVHRIKMKFGAGAPLGMIFKARTATGEIARLYTEAVDVETDHVTSRVMWLQGMEPGVNQGKGVDSFDRYIYIHGTHEEGLIGQPASHGCVRMRNRDVIELFDQLPVNTPVVIQR